MQKRGQFYLLTAVILATLLIGVATVSNYVRQTPHTNTAINNAKNSLQIESSDTTDYGTNQGFNDAQMQSLLTNFTNNYIRYDLQGSGYFIFGTPSGLRVISHQDNNDNVSFNAGSGFVNLNLTQGTTSTADFTPTGTTVSIKINQFQYLFELSAGENYYFVLAQKNNDGTYIVTS